MSKKIIIAVLSTGFLLAVWAFIGRDTTEQLDIFVSPGMGDFQVIVTSTGELRAKNSIQIRGPQGVRDVQIWQMTIQSLVPEGTVVKKGDVVAEIDRSEIMTRMQNTQLDVQRAESQYEQAQLDSSLTLTQARDNLENLHFQLEERQIAVEQSVYESPAVQRQVQIELERTQRQLAQEQQNYKTRVLQAEANLREIEANLTQEQNKLNRIMQVMQDFSIKAPENGMVVYARNWQGRKTTTGSTINSFDPVVAELPDFSAMESLTYINEVDIQKIRQNQTVYIGLDAIRDKKLTGVVTSIANIGEQRPNSHSKVFEVKIEINESDTTLRPAMTTSNEILIETIENALFIPLESVHAYDNDHFVFKRDGIQTVMQQIIMGSANDNDVVILEGLTLDDQVLISMPPDTAGLRRYTLPDDVLDKYREIIEPEEVTPEQELEIAQSP
jgi:multidrug efflux pump subunit AcrA (membrane-fusion protein)